MPLLLAGPGADLRVQPTFRAEVQRIAVRVLERVRRESAVSYKIHRGDCIQGMRSLQRASVDLVITSPPYNIGTKYKQYDDSMSRLKYLAWTHSWIFEVARILKPDGSLFLNIGGTPRDQQIPYEVLGEAVKLLTLQNVFHWIKSIAIDAEDIGAGHDLADGISVGHYKPINSPRFVNDCHEHVFHLTPSGNTPLDRLAIGVPYADKANSERWAGGKDLRCRGNTWFLPYPTIQKGRAHPAVFPVKLPERCIKVHGVDRAETVVDPFTGIGSTAIACIALGINFVGYEIDPEYCAAAIERCEKAVADK